VTIISDEDFSDLKYEILKILKIINWDVNWDDRTKEETKSEIGKLSMEFADYTSFPTGFYTVDKTMRNYGPRISHLKDKLMQIQSESDLWCRGVVLVLVDRLLTLFRNYLKKNSDEVDQLIKAGANNVRHFEEWKDFNDKKEHLRTVNFEVLIKNGIKPKNKILSREIFRKLGWNSENDVINFIENRFEKK